MSAMDIDKPLDEVSDQRSSPIAIAKSIFLRSSLRSQGSDVVVRVGVAVLRRRRVHPMFGQLPRQR